jgi:Flp pilus assembly pilin Flp
VKSTFLQLLKNKRAATAIEYSLIVAGIAVAVSVVVFSVGTDLVSLFSGLGTVLGNSVSNMG